ncbi:MAG: hypothetical protein ACJ8C4_14605 [Gemmataceae bacterium]
MARCDPFQITVTGDLQSAFDRAKSQITAAGGTFTGNANGGSFSGQVPVMGSIAGQYTVSGNVVTVTITDKPFLVPCATIEKKVREYFG